MFGQSRHARNLALDNKIYQMNQISARAYSLVYIARINPLRAKMANRKFARKKSDKRKTK